MSTLAQRHTALSFKGLALLAMAALALFGPLRPAAAQSGAITGLIFGDTNGNGLHDPGEQGIANVAITFSGVGEPVTGVSNADGSYFFTANVGDWTVTVTPPPGFEVVNGPTQTVNIAAAEQSLVLDFGLRPIQMVTDTPPPDPVPSNTPGLLPTTGAPVATSPLLFIGLILIFLIGAGLLVSAFRRKQPGA